MKRDMDIIRAVLMTAEDDDRKHLANVDAQLIGFHVQLCIDAGFIEGKVITDFNGRTLTYQRWGIMRLTWHGADALDAMRDDTVWSKAKDHVLKPAASWTFSLLLEWLKEEAKRRIFGQPPHG